MTMDKATAEANLAAFVAEINEHDKKIVNEFGENTNDLAEAFKRVENVENWKNPICCVLPKATKTERDRISRAIAFYTGSVAKWEKLRATGWRVTAAGYYKTIGA